MRPGNGEESTEILGAGTAEERTELRGAAGPSSDGAEDGDHTAILPAAEPGEEHTLQLDPDATAASSGGAVVPGPGQSAGPLAIGARFGTRYRIDALLGFGGMGAVYKAWDTELEIPVALKVIRPEVARDPTLADQLDRRFKRELLLARQVTHKNVVRIHDLGELEGIKYITMTYIEGEDLLGVLKRDGRVPVSRALKILRPVVAGLVAAHEAGVVHRDLKPANIMIEPATGESYIMDFGIARSAAPTGIDVAEKLADAKAKKLAGLTEETQAGAVVGTLQYMAPEQFMGKAIDQRADIYSFGLIFYDVLLGRRRIEHAESAFKEFRGRVEEAPPPTRSLDPSIPEQLDRIIARCLEPDPNLRFQSSAELKAALDRLDDEGKLLPVTRRLTRRMVVAAAALVVALVAGTWWTASRLVTAEAPAPMSVLIADFDNRTGDAGFDGALEQALAIAMEGAAFINVFPPANAHALAEQLQPGSRLDETMARLISHREGVGVILVGEISGSGERFELEVRALDPGLEPGEAKPLAAARARARGRERVLAAVAELAAELRGELGDTAPASEREAAAETFTAASLEAMQAYARGQDLAAQGRFEEALAAYGEAVASDPGFGRAHAGRGVVYGNLRREADAEAAFQQAFQYLDRMSERERYRTLGGYYLLVSRNYEKAIENYQALVERYPADGVGQGNLAFAYLSTRDFARAVTAGRAAVDLEPNNLVKRINYAMYAMYAGDFATAMTESNKVLEQNPDFGYALLTLGRSAMASGDESAARASFERLGASGGMGSSLAPLGLADLALYHGRAAEAAAILEPAIASSGNAFERAAMLVASGEARLLLGDAAGATAAANTAAALSNHESVLYLAARLLLAAGKGAEAEEIAVSLDNRLQSQTSALARLVRAERDLGAGRLADAVAKLREGTQGYDLWFAHYLSGLAYLEAGHYPEAIDELELCVRRKGEITDVFLLDSATLRYYPPALYWLGRAEQGLGAAEQARARFREYLEIRGGAEPADELAADAAQRLGG
jgi:tetratricopeptide (TPR) repeat protein/tRNA A-37 threonylcarbamoyl transferase component Bud32